MRVGRDIGRDILHFSTLTVGHFLIIVHECVALPMRGAPQRATCISGRFETGEESIGLRLCVPPDCDEPPQVPADLASGMAFGDERGPAPDYGDMYRPAASCTLGTGIPLLHRLDSVPIAPKHL